MKHMKFPHTPENPACFWAISATQSPRGGWSYIMADTGMPRGCWGTPRRLRAANAHIQAFAAQRRLGRGHRVTANRTGCMLRSRQGAQNPVVRKWASRPAGQTQGQAAPRAEGSSPPNSAAPRRPVCRHFGLPSTLWAACRGRARVQGGWGEEVEIRGFGGTSVVTPSQEIAKWILTTSIFEVVSLRPVFGGK